MASHVEVGTEKVDKKMQKAEPNLDRMARRVQNLFKFKFQMGSDLGQHLAITKAVI